MRGAGGVSSENTGGVSDHNSSQNEPPLLRGAGGVSSRNTKGVSSKNTRGVSSKGAESSSGRRTIIPYNPKLKELARKLRNESTKAEIQLWTALKGKFDDQYDFHRQKPLDNYIADFYCHELKLVIEVDGSSHNWEETQQKDFEKESRFNALGLNVLRFDDDLVINHLESALHQVRAYIDGYMNGNLSGFMHEDTLLNPLSRQEYHVKKHTPNPSQEGNVLRFQSLDDVYDAIGDGKDDLFTRQEANEIVNSLKICDPAVGSGHFLVSALNEIIAIKNDLKIFQDRDGKRLKEYVLEVVNDELVITDDDGELFEYSINNKESQRLQEALFHEKQTIIENCLFGVDINPNSVKICRLRLWIELLKNAYYKTPLSRGVGGVSINPSQQGKYGELETLPNIDINIKCGNSLISRFDLDADIHEALKKSKWSIDSYRMAVAAYRNAQSKEEKHEMQRLINDIKSDFRSEISKGDPKLKKRYKLNGELANLTTQTSLFDMSAKDKKAWNQKVERLTKDINKLETEIDEIKNNKIYENAFEWRFEFPEVLNDEGDFVGFDVVIGNPPYINANDFKKLVGEREYKFYKSIYATAKGTVDVYIYFFELGFKILGDNQKFCFITPNRFLSANYGVALRKFIIDKFKILSIGDYSNVKVFSEASTYPIVTLLEKNITDEEYELNSYTFFEQNHTYKFRFFNSKLLTYLNDNILGFLLSDKFEITRKIIDSSIPLENVGKINATSTAGEAEAFHEFITEEIDGFRLINTGTIDAYSTTWGVSNMTDKGQKYINPYLPKDPVQLGANRYSLYSNPKIILAKIALRTEAFYDVDGVYSSINTNCIHSFSDNYDPFFVCAWLNSKLYQYLFECFFDGLRMAGGYLLYSAPNLLNTYIKNYNDINQTDISAKSEKILSLKKENPEANTSALEAEIDQLVYKLYDLTEEEIEIIENG